MELNELMEYLYRDSKNLRGLSMALTKRSLITSMSYALFLHLAMIIEQRGL